MNQEKKVNKIFLQFRILLVHVLVFYNVFGFMYHEVIQSMFRMGFFKVLLDLPEAVLFYSIIGFFVVIDGGMFYACMIIMAILFFGFNVGCFKAYYLSIANTIIIWLFWFPAVANISFLESLEFISKFFIPSAAIAITVNWLVFRKTYKRLKKEDLRRNTRKLTDEDDNNENR